MRFKLVEPLRYLFKDEVRQIGQSLGLPVELVWRQPFPGPGLAVRCLGEITPERIECLQNADNIFISELTAEGLVNKKTNGENNLISQAFAALLAGSFCWRYGRSAHLSRGDRFAGSNHRRFHDRRLGSDSPTGIVENFQQNCQRGKRGQPCGLRHHQQTTGDH